MLHHDLFLHVKTKHRKLDQSIFTWISDKAVLVFSFMTSTFSENLLGHNKMFSLLQMFK